MFTDSALARQPDRAGFVSNRRSAKRYATEQFVPLLSRRSRISAGFVYPIKCAGRRDDYDVCDPRRPVRGSIKKGDT